MTRENAHAALLEQIRAPHARPVPCTDGAKGWISDELDEQREVAVLCRYCPVLEACAAYLDEYGERAGVWAGSTTKQRNAATGKPKPKGTP